MKNLRSFHALVVILLIAGAAAVAQSRRSREKQNGKTLEIRARKAEETLAREYIAIANGFYDLGKVEQARDYLVRLNELREGLPGVQEKIKELEEQVMQSNAQRITLNTADGWGNKPVAQVTAGDAIRVTATGDYKMNASLTMTPAGLRPGQNPVNDLARNVPFGALMGIVVGSDGKPSRPFAIRAGAEYTPKRSGALYLRVNTPPSAKCVGRLQVQLSGKLVGRKETR